MIAVFSMKTIYHFFTAKALFVVLIT